MSWLDGSSARIIHVAAVRWHLSSVGMLRPFSPCSLSCWASLHDDRNIPKERKQEPRLRSCTISLLPYPIGQSKSKGQPTLKGRWHRVHLVVAESIVKGHGCRNGVILLEGIIVTILHEDSVGSPYSASACPTHVPRDQWTLLSLLAMTCCLSTCP